MATTAAADSLKVVVVGDERIGKTSLLRRHTNGGFDEEYAPTIGVDLILTDSSRYQLSHDSFRITLWDTSGQERFAPMITPFFRNAQVILICYSMTDRRSFVSASQWHSVVAALPSSGDLTVALVGLKADEPDCCVTAEEAQEVAESRGSTPFVTSAKTGAGVPELFQWLTAALQQLRANPRPPTPDDPFHHSQSSPRPGRSEGFVDQQQPGVDCERLLGALGWAVRGTVWPLRAAQRLPLALRVLAVLPAALCTAVGLLLCAVAATLFVLPVLFVQILRPEPEVLTEEFVQQRQERGQWGTLVVGALLALLLLGVPTVLVLYDPPFASVQVCALAYALGVTVLLFAALLLSSLRPGALRPRKAAAAPDAPFRLGNAQNWAVIVTVVLEALQLGLLPLRQLAPATENDIDAVAEDYLLPAVFFAPKTAWPVAFVASLALAAVVVVGAARQVMADTARLPIGDREGFYGSLTGSILCWHSSLRKLDPGVIALFVLLAEALFLPVTLHLLSVLNCADDGVVQHFRDWDCWDTPHLLAVALAMAAWGYYALLAATVAPLVSECDPARKDVHWIRPFSVAVAFAKFVLAVVSELPIGSPLPALLTTSATCLLLWAAIFFGSYQDQLLRWPSSRAAVNVWRSAGFLCGLLGGLVALGAYAESSARGADALETVLYSNYMHLAVAFALSAILTVALWWPRWSVRQLLLQPDMATLLVPMGEAAA